MSDLETARRNMVESQVRPSSVTNRRLIDAMSTVPREAFVPSAQRSMAYMDEDVAIATASDEVRYLMQPMLFAKLAQLAKVETHDLVLDVGCGTGYSTAIFAALAESVVALECDEALAAQASETLLEHGMDNTAVVVGELLAGYAEEGPYDAIFLNGAVSDVPRQLLDQLKAAGRLVAVVGAGPVGRAHVFTRHDDIVAQRVAFDASIRPLPGATAAEPAFVF